MKKLNFTPAAIFYMIRGHQVKALAVGLLRQIGFILEDAELIVNKYHEIPQDSEHSATFHSFVEPILATYNKPGRKPKNA